VRPLSWGRRAAAAVVAAVIDTFYYYYYRRRKTRGAHRVKICFGSTDIFGRRCSPPIGLPSTPTPK